VQPSERDTLHIHSSTQGVSHVQAEVVRVLGMGAHKVFVHVKRIGGGFGGKETAAVIVAVPTAAVAKW
jgi:xanthine dehydrogenase molybdopterin-binding subunit B